jgi:phosphoribosylaminoimidazole-succinocarboxamide synthase
VRLVQRGKVREIYDVGEHRLLIVASDRISAYDVVLPTEIPDKGRVLTGLTAHWCAVTEDIVPNHIVSLLPERFPEEARSSDFAGRSMLVDRLEMLPIECVARGYLAGSGWRDYVHSGEVSGHRLPTGLRQADELPEPIFTPATKAFEGHDENITRAEAADLVGAETAAELERITLAVYRRAAGRCREAGIILADTKLELGRDTAGRLVLADEVLTPDSSRFWPADRYRTGESPPSYDKQFVRDWLDAQPWDHRPPAPELPFTIVTGTRARYVEAFERLAGRPFTEYVLETSV